MTTDGLDESAGGLPVEQSAGGRATTQPPGRSASALAPTPAERRGWGAFFTPPWLAARLAAPYRDLVAAGWPVVDPTCGGGELLLAARALAPEARVPVIGADIVQTFLDDAGIRLSSPAQTAGPVELRLHDGVRSPGHLCPTHPAVFLMNPPFVCLEAAGVTWARGKVSAAALSVAAVLEAAQPGSRVAAILPDVLRSGSRYRRWRALVGGRLADLRIEVVGAFSPEVDVDVFILRGTVATGDGSEWPAPASAADAGGERVGDRFFVSVGPVVPHRDAHTGPGAPYLDVAHAPAWGKASADQLPRRHWAGRTATPPFLVVRRTSSPRDAGRCIASLVEGSSGVAVENHLLVLQPRDGSLSTCVTAMASLRSPRVLEHLNVVIRCRHLTVASVADVPLASPA